MNSGDAIRVSILRCAVGLATTIRKKWVKENIGKRFILFLAVHRMVIVLVELSLLINLSNSSILTGMLKYNLGIFYSRALILFIIVLHCVRNDLFLALLA